MSKRDKIDHILSLLAEQIEQYLEFEDRTGFELSAEELVIAAVETVTSQQITRIQYGSPVAFVDRLNVSYALDEENVVPIWEEEDDTNPLY